MKTTGNIGRVLSIRFFMMLCSALILCGTVAKAAGTISLGVDEAKPMKYQTPIDTVFIANPEVADYQVVKGNQLVVFGKKVGSTSLLVLSESGRTIDSKTLSVNKSLSFIRQQVIARFPDTSIEINNLGDEVILSGLASSEQERQDVYNLIGEVLGKEYVEEKLSWEVGDSSYDIKFLTNRQYKGLINNIEIDEVKQVNVKLTIAEVSHSFIRQLGIKWGTVNADGSAFNFGSGVFFDTLGNSLNSSNIARYISAVDDDSMGQVLAEPNLSVISGESASFLAGGEMPIITYVDDSQNITYKDFGVRLDLAAEVLKNDKINLSLLPEVSAIDPSIENDLNLPGFKTRRARTTVQLGDGQSFVLGGLMNTEDREALSKVPLIGDIPVLGAMFRHTSDTRQKSELIIVATVNLVKPVESDTVLLPQFEMSTSSLLRYLNLPKPDFKNTPPILRRQAMSVLAAGGFKQ